MVEETAGLSRARSCARLLFWSLLLLVSFLLARLDLRHSTTSLLDPGAGVVFLWLVSGGRRTWVVDGVVIVALTAIFSTWAGTSAASTTLWFILLAPAVVTVAALRGFADSLSPVDPVARLWTNHDGTEVADGAAYLDLLVGQVASPVRWDRCMESFSGAGITGLVELAPAGTLTGLVKRQLKGTVTTTIALKTPADLAKLQEQEDAS